MMAFIRLNDNVLVDEYCDVGEDNCVKMRYPECLRVCYNDEYKCNHWKQIFKPLWQIQEEQRKAK